MVIVCPEHHTIIALQHIIQRHLRPRLQLQRHRNGIIALHVTVREDVNTVVALDKMVTPEIKNVAFAEEQVNVPGVMVEAVGKYENILEKYCWR